MSKKYFNTPIPDESMFDHGVEPESVEEKYITTPIPKKYGVVSNCEKLRIRKEPNKKNGEILCVVEKGSSLLIDEKRSTIMWYAVTTPSGIEGFCMKEYVTV